MNIFKIFKAIQDEPSKNGKLALLKEHDTPELRQALLYTYDKFRTYRVKQIDYPAEYNTLQPDVSNQLYQLLDLLAKHETGSNEAKGLIRQLLAKCTEENARWVVRIITRDLKIGIDESTINKAFKGLIPVFDCQLAHPVYSEKTGKNYWPTIQYPAIVEEKLDGYRVIAVCKGGKVTLYSREGFEQDDRGVFAQQILNMLPGVDFVLDGEVLATKFNPDNKTAVKNAHDNWPFYSGKSIMQTGTREEIKEYLTFFVWDILDLDYFETQGVKGKAKTLRDRKGELLALFERQDIEFRNVVQVDNYVVHNEVQIKDFFTKIRQKGGEVAEAVNKKGETVQYTWPKGEGCMIKNLSAPYEFKRSAAILKVKQFSSMDLRIVGAYEGEADTKFEGSLGGLTLESDCGSIKTDCGGGFSDALRLEYWTQYLEGRLTGKIVEVSYMDVTADGALRHPNFLRERPDRTTTSVEG